MSKFAYQGHEHGSKVVLALPILDGHLRPLVNCRVLDAESEEAKELVEANAAFPVEAGRPFIIDHTDYARGLNWVHDWCCSHQSFQVLDREVLPRQVAHPHLSKTPHKHF